MKRNGCLTVVGICILLVALIIGYTVIARAGERYRARKAFKAATPSELEKVVSPLGAVLRFKDGSWLAIRYNDSHNIPGWSLSVAHDSGGMWFESTEHFCGFFGFMRTVDELGRIRGLYPSPPHDPPADLHEWVRFLAISPDLPTARQRLARYFHQVK